MKKSLIALAVAAASLTASTSFAQSVYGGVGVLGLYNIGYQHTINDSFGLRAQYADSLKYEKDGSYDGVAGNVQFNYQTTGLFADWHPFNGSFRLVGGLSINDIKINARANGTGTAVINGQTVNMAGEYYNMQVKMPDTMPYLGIGYGHNPASKGFGFYADFGLMFGKAEVTTSTSLVASGKLTQADVDAQRNSAQDAVNQLGYIPVLQTGVSYRF